MPTETEKIFTKSDYLTPLQVAHALNIDEETAYRAMKTMYLRKATVKIKAAPRPMVICSRYSHSTKNKILPYRLRSDALENFKEHIKIQQAKEK